MNLHKKLIRLTNILGVDLNVACSSLEEAAPLMGRVTRVANTLKDDGYTTYSHYLVKIRIVNL